MFLIKLFFTISKSTLLLGHYLLDKKKFFMTKSNLSGPKRLSKNSIFKIEDSDAVKQPKSLFYKLRKRITKFFK